MKMNKSPWSPTMLVVLYPHSSGTSRFRRRAGLYLEILLLNYVAEEVKRATTLTRAQL